MLNHWYTYVIIIIDLFHIAQNSRYFHVTCFQFARMFGHECGIRNEDLAAPVGLENNTWALLCQDGPYNKIPEQWLLAFCAARWKILLSHSQTYILANHVTQTYLCFHNMVYKLAQWEDTISTPFPASRPEYYFSGHCGSVCCVERSPFFRDIILSVGGWTFALWKEGAKVRRSRGRRFWLRWEECVWPLYCERRNQGMLGWHSGSRYRCVTLVSWKVGHYSECMGGMFDIKISSDSVETFFQFEFISAPIHLSSFSRVMLCWSPVAPPFPSQEGRGLQPDQVRGEWQGCISTEWSG